jgi:hypothetical protein
MVLEESTQCLAYEKNIKSENKNPEVKSWEPEKERRLQRVLSQVVMDAEVTKKLLFEDTQALRLAFADERQHGKAEGRVRSRHQNRHVQRGRAVGNPA